MQKGSLFRMALARIPVRDRLMDIHAFGRRGSNGPEVVALVHGFSRAPDHAAVLRIHSACFTGDVLGSAKCDCGAQLDAALDVISRAPWGILLYFIKHEGRGIGLIQKLNAYVLQSEGFDTVTANLQLHEEVDARDYSGGIEALAWLGAKAVWLLSNNPDKARMLRNFGIRVVGIKTVRVGASIFNRDYRATKEAILNHARGAFTMKDCD